MLLEKDYEVLPTSDPNSTSSNPPPSSSFASRIGAHLPSVAALPRPTLHDLLHTLSARPARWTLYLGSIVVTLLLLAGLGHTPTQTRLGNYANAALGSWTSGDSREISGNEGLLEPTYQRDPISGHLFPPDVYPASLNPYKRASAAIVALVRNYELPAMQNSMRHVEERFNRKYGYPWVFMNDEPFTEEFKKGVLSMTRSNVDFAIIPSEHWGYPDSVNQTYAAEERQKMVNEGVIYGGSESYRHMCRFNSGFFFQQEVLLEYDYYWRVEPGIELFCDIDYDPFLFMQANNKKYSFTISLYEYERTIQTLWKTVQDFAQANPQYIDPDNALDFMVDDSQGLAGQYNLCHFWSNFEIADLRFWRSPAYQDFFKYLDDTGNFFYERWGDAPVHSMAAVLFLPKDQIHFFSDIAYQHNPYVHCPRDRAKFYDNGKCNCPVERSFDNDGYSCLNRWWRVAKNYDP